MTARPASSAAGAARGAAPAAWWRDLVASLPATDRAVLMALTAAGLVGYRALTVTEIADELEPVTGRRCLRSVSHAVRRLAAEGLVDTQRLEGSDPARHGRWAAERARLSTAALPLAMHLAASDRPRLVRLVPRACLCCRRPFLADGRYLRLCRSCKAGAS